MEVSSWKSQEVFEILPSVSGVDRSKLPNRSQRYKHSILSRPGPVSMIDEPATCRPPAPLHPAAKRDECLVGIAHDFHRSGLTGREKPTTTSSSTFSVRSHCICARCALSRPINYSTRNGLSMPLGSIGKTLVWEKSLRKLISSPPGNAGRRSVLNR